MEAFDALLYLCAATLAEDGGGRAQQFFPGKRKVASGEAHLRPGKRRQLVF